MDLLLELVVLLLDQDAQFHGFKECCVACGSCPNPISNEPHTLRLRALKLMHAEVCKYQPMCSELPYGKSGDHAGVQSA
jgi:hypothetical protein